MEKIVIIIVLILTLFCKKTEIEELKDEINQIENSIKDLCSKKIDRVEFVNKFDYIINATLIGMSESSLINLNIPEKIAKESMGLVWKETGLFSRGEDFFIFIKNEEIIGHIVATKMGCYFYDAEGTKEHIIYDKDEKIIYRRVEPSKE